MAYLLDANVFIGAKNLHYGLDFCPAFWEWLIASNASGGVFSIEKVGDEVLALADELSAWAGGPWRRFFSPAGRRSFPCAGGGERLGQRATLRAVSREYLPSSGRLLSCSSCARLDRSRSCAVAFHTRWEQTPGPLW